MSKLKDLILNFLDPKDPKDSSTSQEGNVGSNQPDPQQAKPNQDTQSMGDSSLSENKADSPKAVSSTDNSSASSDAASAAETLNEQPSSPLLGKDNIATCNNVKQAILHHLVPYLGAEGIHTLVVYIPDQTLFTVLSVGKFKEMLHTELMQAGHSFSSERIINENPPAERALKCVSDSFYCDVKGTSVDPSVSEMRVRVYENCGKTLQERYILPCTERACYNIGRGENPGNTWQNNIAFNPDPNDSLYRVASGFVRSKHACIRVVGGKYYLFAYPDGTESQGSRTQLFHPDNQITEEVEVNAPRLLRPGDIIILGKNAKLIFEENLQYCDTRILNLKSTI